MRQVIVLSVLLAAAMAASYVTWTAEAETAPVKGDTDVLVYDGTAKDLQSIRWQSDTLTAEVSRRTDARGDYLWVEATERKEVEPEKAPEESPDPAKPEDPAAPADPAKPEDPAKPADPAAADPAKPEAEPAPAADPAAPVQKQIEEKKASFRGGEAADKLWEAFAPLHALRELSLPQSPDLALYGLDAPVATITVTRASGAVELKVGGETYGAKDRYVMVGSKVYLLAQDTTRPLEFAATRLVERRLVPFTEEKVDRVEASVDGKTLSLVQTNKDDKEKAFWAKADAPTEAFKSGDAWIGKLLKLNVKLYVDEATLLAPLTPVLTWTVTSDGESWKVELLRTEGEAPEYYARSEFDRGLVSLTRTTAAEVAADLADLLQ